MAFHQPVQQRAVRVDSSNRQSVDLAPQVRSGPDESQTWVLFSPATDAGTTTSYLSSAQESQHTAGRSRISDLGSLGTLARSDINSRPQNSAAASDFFDESLAEEDAELDSLDSHLPEFRAASSPYHDSQAANDSTPVLPGHDGLGSFRLDTQGMSVDAQEQLYAFERYNPRRIKRRRESLERGQQELESDVQETDRMRWIEAWRMEQSKFLLDQIQKETRRRHSVTPSQRSRTASGDGVATASASALDKAAEDFELSNNEWHDQDTPGLTLAQDGFWSRITRTFIRDLMGIDDRLLSILFGETFPEDDDLSSTPRASSSDPAASDQNPEELPNDPEWQAQMLDRIAREFGQFVHQMSSHHPGAFSTYKRMQQAPIPYAGLPVIPETGADANQTASKKATGTTPSMPQFQPTITQPVDIPGSRTEPSMLMQATLDDLTGRAEPAETFTQQEWEQDLDIKLVFRYLRSRFSSARSPPTFNSGTSHLATSSTQDAAAKAARVRQHHPLVAHSHPHTLQRSRTTERRISKVTTPSSPVVIRHHRSGSCASQSTRQSNRRSSVSSRHSSRHYWDIGGSIGTGSMIASTGPMGSWGEV